MSTIRELKAQASQDVRLISKAELIEAFADATADLVSEDPEELDLEFIAHGLMLAERITVRLFCRKEVEDGG